MDAAWLQIMEGIKRRSERTGDVTMFVATEDAVDVSFEGWTRPEHAAVRKVRGKHPFGGRPLPAREEPVPPRAADCTDAPRLPDGDAHVFERTTLMGLAALIADLVNQEYDLVEPRLSKPARLTPEGWPHVLGRVPSSMVVRMATTTRTQLARSVALASMPRGADRKKIRAQMTAIVRLSRASFDGGMPLWAYSPTERAHE